MKTLFACSFLILFSAVAAQAAPSDPSGLAGAFENVLKDSKCGSLGETPTEFVEHFWSGNVPNHYVIGVSEGTRVLTSVVNESEASKLTLDFDRAAIAHPPSGLRRVTDCTLRPDFRALCIDVLEQYLEVTQTLIEKEGWLQTSEEHAKDERTDHRFRKFESESHGEIARSLECVNWLTREFLDHLSRN
jgi:hypothetical protein